jgi:hypothetical protein
MLYPCVLFNTNGTIVGKDSMPTTGDAVIQWGGGVFIRKAQFFIFSGDPSHLPYRVYQQAEVHVKTKLSDEKRFNDPRQAGYAIHA